VDPKDIDEWTPEYTAALDHLISLKVAEKIDKSHIIRSRREVIQHTKALDYITRAIAIDNEPLTEQLIKETHRILVTGIDREDTGHGRGDTSWEAYGGT